MTYFQQHRSWKSDKSWKHRPHISHFHKSFFWCISNDASQSVDELMVKFKGCSSIKQYVNNKPIKWGFKFWNCCASKAWYLCQFDLYSGKKELTEENLGGRVVLTLTECLENTCCTIVLISSAACRLLQSSLRRVPMQLEVLKKTREGMPEMTASETRREVIMSFCFL